MISRTNRICLTVAICVSMAAAIGAATPNERLDAHKAELVGQALRAQGGAHDDPVLIDAAERAAVLVGIEGVGQLGAADLLIHTQGATPCNVFALDDGMRCVIDLYDTINALPTKSVQVSGRPAIKAIRTSMYAVEPQLVSRIVIDLTQPREPRVVVAPNGILVTLAEPAGESESILDALDRVAAELASREQALDVQQSRIDELVARCDFRFGEAAKEVAESARFGPLLDERQSKNAGIVDRFARQIADARKQVRSLSDQLADLRDSLGDEVGDVAVRVALQRIEDGIAACATRADTFKALYAECESANGALHERVLALVAEARTQSKIDDASAIIDLASLDSELIRMGGTEIAATPETIEVAESIVAWLDNAEAEQAANAAAMANIKKSSSPAVPKSFSEKATVPTPAVSSETFEIAAAPDWLILPAVPASVHAATDEQPEPAPEADLAEAVPAAEEKTADEQPKVEEAVKVDEPAKSEEPNTEEAKPAEAPTAEDAPKGEEVKPAEQPKAEEEPKMTEVKPLPLAEVLSDVEIEAKTELPKPKYAGDPLKQPVSIDFREMELANVVALLAQKGDINVIAGTDVTGTVTASIRDIPLMHAMDIVLRMNGLGVVEEEGIYRIVPYEEAAAARRTTRLVFLQNGKADEVKSTLDAIVLGFPDAQLISIAANATTNVLVVSGPEDRVTELETLIAQLDVAEPVTPTITEAIKLNYAEPSEVKTVVTAMLTKEIGQVEEDTRGRHIVVTDVPAVVNQVREVVKQIDSPVKQVAIEAMIVNAVLRDASQTGVNWLLDIVRERDAAGNAVGNLAGRENTRGDLIGNLQDLNLAGNLGNVGTDALDAGIMTFGVLSADIDFRGAIAAEVGNRNAEILANPVVVTVENKKAVISIVQEFPYQEITQSTQGPPVASTEFKPIGVNLEVSPRVTHEDDIIVDVTAKQSSVTGLTEDGIPIEDKREATTTLLTGNGRTVFIGGLRNYSDRTDVSKIPVLGDIPVAKFLFSTTDIEKVNTELLVFLTCDVVQKELPELTAEQQSEHDKLEGVPRVPDAQRAMFRSMKKPGEMRDPAWKWRRAE